MFFTVEDRDRETKSLFDLLYKSWQIGNDRIHRRKRGQGSLIEF